YPDVWAGAIKQQAGEDINAFVDSVPGGRAALDIVDAGLMFAGGPIRLMGGAAYGLVENHLASTATHYYQEAGYGDETSGQGGEGLVWMGSLALKGIGGGIMAGGIFGPRTHSHHLLPREFEGYFTKAGLNIEDYRIPLPDRLHTLKPDGIHTGPRED